MEETARLDGERAAGEALPGYAYLRSLAVPLLTLGFFLVQPRAWWAVAAFATAPFLLDWLGARSGAERRQPAAGETGRWLDLILYAFFVLHWVNLIAAARTVAATGWASPVAAVSLVLVVISSGLTGASAGHELIHRRSPVHRWMGRVLLASLLYEHFYTEHLRGHHVRAGTTADPVTARFGETLVAYLRRAVVGQLAGAWALERARLASEPSLWLRWAQNRVVQGVLVEIALGAAFWALFGWRGFLMLLLQAIGIHGFFQIVTYFEHWGLVHEGGEDAAPAWDTDNQSTLFSMIGVARHSDHHVHPARPFHLLEHRPESPKLPRGYAGMIWLALARNGEFRRLMTEELERTGRYPEPRSPGGRAA